MKDFKSLELHPTIHAALESKGYTHPTPIQEKAIPALLEGRDLIGIAQTGTGKTAAFSLPILQRLSANKVKTKAARVRALILTPTRELASQINENITLYGQGLDLSSAVMFGGVSSFHQIKSMQKGLQILIATPGRLLDLMEEGHVLYDQLEVFVLDEADRMLDMGFIRDVKRIIAKLPKEKQTILFSATMPEEIEEIAAKLMKNPVKVEVTPQATTVEKIGQSVVFLDKQKKGVLLQQIIKDKNIECGLVFSRTKHGCDKIVRVLEKYGIAAAAIHGNKSQNARERALKDFKDGRVAILVATDIAARGIDIPGVAYVFNYDIPNDPSSYVHRIGRTARAGRDGLAIAFCDDTEKSLLRSVEKLIKQKIAEDRELTQLAQTLKVPEIKRPMQGQQRTSNFEKRDSQERSSSRGQSNRRPPSRGSDSGNRRSGNSSSSSNRFGKRTG